MAAPISIVIDARTEQAFKDLTNFYTQTQAGLRSVSTAAVTAATVTSNQLKQAGRALSSSLSGLTLAASSFAGPQVASILFPLQFVGRELRAVSGAMRLAGISAPLAAAGFAGITAAIIAGITGFKAYKAALEEAATAAALVAQQSRLEIRLIDLLNQNQSRLPEGTFFTLQKRLIDAEEDVTRLKDDSSKRRLQMVMAEVRAELEKVHLSEANKQKLQELTEVTADYYRQSLTGYNRERAELVAWSAEEDKKIAKLATAAKTDLDRQQVHLAGIVKEEAFQTKLAELDARYDKEKEQRLEREKNLLDAIAERKRKEQEASIRNDFRATDAEKFSRLSAAGVPQSELGPNPASFSDQFAVVFTQLREMNNLAQETAQSFGAVFNTAISSISNGITGLIMGTLTWRQALQQIGNTILTSIINAIVEMGVRWIATRIVMAVAGKAIEAASVAATAPLAAAQAAIWAVPATLATIASFGGAAAAAPGFIALAEAVTMAQAIVPRESGGPVLADHAYLVGERGPEIFVPRASGYIDPRTSSSRDSGRSEPMSIILVNDSKQEIMRAMEGEAGRRIVLHHVKAGRLDIGLET